MKINKFRIHADGRPTTVIYSCNTAEAAVRKFFRRGGISNAEITAVLEPAAKIRPNGG